MGLSGDFTSDKTLVCRRCKVPPKIIREEGSLNKISCPVCGVNEDFDVARRRAAEHANRDLMKGISNLIASKFKRSKSSSSHPRKAQTHE